MRIEAFVGTVPVAVLLTALTGCASPAPEPTAPATTAGTVTPTADPEVLSGFLCAAYEGNVWRGKALLTNIGTTTNSYTVRFSVLRASDGGSVGFAEDRFTLAGGESTDITFPDIHTGDPAGLRCVPEVSAMPAG
ncbi:hypothetical protein [Arthrobacter agilis]|uniref:hypothetical protein n=1 Tax=Arthrobacter agilis TaxID=37921 RepID=UPI002786D280|nr:hypothetical protein [Arthrobacter agilis]MDQ0734978.1 hypothetical protein [Arthrobacter agilis]